MLRPDRPNHGACLRADFIADMPSRVDRADWQWQHRSRNRNRPMMSRGKTLEPAVRLLKVMRIQLKKNGPARSTHFLAPAVLIRTLAWHQANHSNAAMQKAA